jgi:hypothetical protein
MINAAQLARHLPDHLARQRWFGGDHADAAGAAVDHLVPLGDSPAVLARVIVTAAGARWQLLVGARPVDEATAVVEGKPDSVLGTIETDRGPMLAYDALIDAELSCRILELATAGGARAIPATLDGESLARGRDGFLAGAGLDGSVPPLEKVPSLRHAQLAATSSEANEIETIVISFVVENGGPGDAYAVRGIVQADHPHLDGRVIYVGKLPRGETARPALSIRVPVDAVPADTVVRLYVRDGHDTAPAYSLTARVAPRLKTM